MLNLSVVKEVIFHVLLILIKNGSCFLSWKCQFFMFLGWKWHFLAFFSGFFGIFSCMFFENCQWDPCDSQQGVYGTLKTLKTFKTLKMDQATLKTLKSDNNIQEFLENLEKHDFGSILSLFDLGFYQSLGLDKSPKNQVFQREYCKIVSRTPCSRVLYYHLNQFEPRKTLKNAG